MSGVRESRVDVLVIGAGPSGLMCANALARAGVDVRIVDQRPNQVMVGQADGIQPRTIEVLESYGLAERLLKEGNQMHMAAFYNPGPGGEIKLTTRAPDISAPTARYPFEITIHQGVVESIFLDSLHSYGVKVERPVIPTELVISQDQSVLEDPEAYPIKVTLKRLDASDSSSTSDSGTEVVHAKFALGADGAHSWVRKSIGISMEGEQTDYIWGVIDLIPQTTFPDIRNRCLIHSDSGSCMIIPREEDMVRMYIQLSDPSVLSVMNMNDGSGRMDKSGVGPLELLAAANKSLYPYHIETPEKFDWWTLYVIGQRVASSFSVHERVFISGDACHTHSPKAGLGMNASMNDTHNLAWKLVQVLRGRAQMSLLKTYEFERRKYAQDLIDFDKKFSALFSGKPLSEINLDGVSHDQFISAFQTQGGFTSGIGVHYAPSAITDPAGQAYAKHIPIGERMPPKILIRAANSRPVELHDLLTSDAKFKVFAFLGSPANVEQMRVVGDVASGLEAMLQPGGLLGEEIVDVFSILKAKKMDVMYNSIPEVFRKHWSRVFIDDFDATETQGGHIYESFGIGEEGAVVVVRPDGYVGMIAPLRGACDALREYFASFLKAPC